MKNQNDNPKPDTAEQPADEGLDVTICSPFFSPDTYAAWDIQSNSGDEWEVIAKRMASFAADMEQKVIKWEKKIGEHDFSQCEKMREAGASAMAEKFMLAQTGCDTWDEMSEDMWRTSEVHAALVKFILENH